VSVLRHGASELFEDDGQHDIVYDNTGIDILLDRSRIEDTNAEGDKSAETQFSHARVWANNTGGLEDVALEQVEESAPDPGVWANILKERERAANEEAALKAEALGRGRRNRGMVDYAGDRLPETEGLELSPAKKRRQSKNPDESDTDFQAEDSDDDPGTDGEIPDADFLDVDDMGIAKQILARKKPGKPPSSNTQPPFLAAVIALKGKKAVPSSPLKPAKASKPAKAPKPAKALEPVKAPKPAKAPKKTPSLVPKADMPKKMAASKLKVGLDGPVLAKKRGRPKKIVEEAAPKTTSTPKKTKAKVDGKSPKSKEAASTPSPKPSEVIDSDPAPREVINLVSESPPEPPRVDTPNQTTQNHTDASTNKDLQL